MKKLLLMLGTCLLMTAFCSSQNIYPKKLLIDGTEIVAILPLQLKGINQLLVERRIYMDATADIKVGMALLMEDIQKANKLNEDKSSLISLQAQQIADLKLLVENGNKNIALMKSEISNQKRKKFRSTAVAVTITAAVTATAVLFIKK